MRGSSAKIALVAVGVILLAFGLRVWQLDAQSLSYEEGYALHLVNLDADEAFAWTSRDLVPPLHTYLLSLWTSLIGASEFSARMLSVCTGTLVVAAAARFGTRLSDPITGLLAGLLSALSPYYVWYSQDARMYALLLLFSLLATLQIAHAVSHPHRLFAWLVAAGLVLLVLYTHSLGILLLLFLALVVVNAAVWLENGRLTLVWGGLALGAAALAWLPWALHAAHYLGENAGYWPGQLDWARVLLDTCHAFTTGQLLSGGTATAAQVLWNGSAIAGLLSLLGRRSSRRRFAAVFLLGYFAVPIVLFLVLFRHIPKFEPRYLILASPPVIVLSAVVIRTLLCARAAFRLVGFGLLAGLILTSTLGLSALYYQPELGRPDFRGAALLVKEQISADEVVALVPGHIFPVWQYYYGSEGWVALPNDPILDVRNVITYAEAAEQMNELLSEHSGIWLVEWQSWVIDPTGQVPYLLEEACQQILTSDSVHGLRVRHFRARDNWSPWQSDPAVPPPEHVALTPALQLIGCDLSVARRGGSLGIGCYWSRLGPLPDTLSVGVRLVEVHGSVRASTDTAITGPHLPPSRWPLGKPVLGQYSLPAPASAGEPLWLVLHVYGEDGSVYGRAVAGQMEGPEP